MPTTPGSPRPRAPTWRRLLRLAWGMAVVAALVLALEQRSADVRAALADLTLSGLGLSTLAAVAGIGVSAQVWRTLLGALGSPLPPRASIHVFFVGQLGKYLPGSVWPALAQMELGRDHDVPPRASAVAVVLFLWVHLLTGAVIALVALPLAGVLPTQAALLGLFSAALLLPSVMGRGVGLALRLARRPSLREQPSARHVVAALGWSAAMWTAYGAHLMALSDGFAAEFDFAFSAGSFAAAWVLGVLVLVAPAGIGAREGIMVGLLVTRIGAGPALAIAVASRLVMTIGDIWWGVVALTLRRRRLTTPRDHAGASPTRSSREAD